MAEWTRRCTVDKNFRSVQGDVRAVADAVRRGADLRRFSTYDPPETGLVEETMALQTTWVFDDEHVGGLATLRHPAEAGLHLFDRPLLAYWIFNVTAPSCSAFVPLDGREVDDATGDWVSVENHPFKREDAPWLSKQYLWWSRDDWKEIHAHDESGTPLKGTWNDVRQAALDGCTLKVGIRDLWAYLVPRDADAPTHEVFIEMGTQFAHVDAGFVGALTLPTFLVRPCTPLAFCDEAFAPGWLLVRTDGKVQRRTLCPATLEWELTWTRHAVRWFAR